MNGERTESERRANGERTESERRANGERTEDNTENIQLILKQKHKASINEKINGH